MSVSARTRAKTKTHPEPTVQSSEREASTCQLYFALGVLISSVLCLAIAQRNLSEVIFTNVETNVTLSETKSLKDFLRFPTVGDAKLIGSLITQYKDDHYYSVFAAYFATYILLQSLCIPGSVVLSIIAGYLFSAPLALIIICTCSTLGASTCYIIIYCKLKKFLLRVIGSRNRRLVDKFDNFVQSQVKENNANLFLCVFMLRATPIFPNWTINLCSPIISLPLKPFVLGTFVGIAPLSVIHVWTGSVLHSLNNDESLVSTQSIILTSLMATSIVLLAYIGRKNKAVKY